MRLAQTYEGQVFTAKRVKDPHNLEYVEENLIQVTLYSDMRAAEPVGYFLFEDHEVEDFIKMLQEAMDSNG